MSIIKLTDIINQVNVFKNQPKYFKNNFTSFEGGGGTT